MSTCARCNSPRSVCVCGHSRKGGRKRRRKAKPRVPKGRYYLCESAKGETCGVHHRSWTAAVRHAKRLRKKERNRAAYFNAGKSRKNRQKPVEWLAGKARQGRA